MSILRIGVDVGGTNTDGVLLDPLATSHSNRGILAWHKSPTTSNPSHGIEKVITTLLEAAKVDAGTVASITIGTTHFINAVLEKDRDRLAPVAVIRLCGPFSRDVPPGVDWPADLRDIICRHCSYVDGGLEVGGELISRIDESQIAAECKVIKEKNIKSIVVNGVFSPSDIVERQEERVAEWVRKYYPEAAVVISKEGSSYLSTFSFCVNELHSRESRFH
jgi:N-methylhydantoinase A/oxoprolinase/acetone carboxylase beta subunit